MMDDFVSNSLPAFGFLTAVEDERHGFFGGYLVLSQLGRPLEFHCSTPVLPSQAQRILYGTTLRSYVLGELIGQTLVKKAQLPVQVVLTDLDEMLNLGLYWDGDLAWLEHKGNPISELGELPSVLSDAPACEVSGFRLVGSPTCRWLPEQLAASLEPMVSYVDLAEPFERIREAILEAQRVTESPAEGLDDHSAAA